MVGDGAGVATEEADAVGVAIGRGALVLDGGLAGVMRSGDADRVVGTDLAGAVGRAGTGETVDAC